MAQFTRARWRLSLLIPAWTAQGAVLLGIMGIFACRLAVTLQDWDKMRAAGDTPMVELVWEVTNIAFSLIALVLTVLEVSKAVGETLTPFFMLSTHTVKLTLAFVDLALDIVVYTHRSERNWSIAGLSLDCGLLITTAIPFAYSFMNFRRLRKYADYVPTGGVRFSEANSYAMANNVQIFATGPPPANGKHRASFTSDDTARSSWIEESQSPPLKIHVNRAVATEFGWGSGNPTAGMVERSRSLVGMGVVTGRRSVASVETFKIVRRDSEHASLGGDIETEEVDDDDEEMERGRPYGRQQFGYGHLEMEADQNSRALLDSGHSYGRLSVIRDASAH